MFSNRRCSILGGCIFQVAAIAAFLGVFSATNALFLREVSAAQSQGFIKNFSRGSFFEEAQYGPNSPKQQLPQIKFLLKTLVPNQKVYLASELSDWKVSEKFRMHESQSGQYSLIIDEPWMPELVYKFVVNGQWMADPTNPRKVPDGHGSFNSYFATRFREDPLLEPQTGLPSLKQQRISLVDYTGELRTITILFPPPKMTKGKSITLYFQDGNDYLNKTGVAYLLSALAAEPNMPRFVGVFIPPKDRNNEYGFSEKANAYMQFLTQTVVPKIEQMFPTGGNPQKRLLIGPSMGGLITIQTAIKYPEVFQNAASQSGAFWVDNEALMPLLEHAPKAPYKFYFDAGTYESDSMVSNSIKAHQIALHQGFESKIVIEPSLHDWLAWRNRLQSIIRYYFDKQFSN